MTREGKTIGVVDSGSRDFVVHYFMYERCVYYVYGSGPVFVFSLDTKTAHKKILDLNYS
jgi:hypothetical protein